MHSGSSPPCRVAPFRTLGISPSSSSSSSELSSSESPSDESGGSCIWVSNDGADPADPPAGRAEERRDFFFFCLFGDLSLPSSRSVFQYISLYARSARAISALSTSTRLMLAVGSNLRATRSRSSTRLSSKKRSSNWSLRISRPSWATCCIDSTLTSL